MVQKYSNNYISTNLETKNALPKNNMNKSICMIDIVNFSNWCSKKSPEEIFNTMTFYNTFLSTLIKPYHDIDKVELVGDSVLIIGGFRNIYGVSKNTQQILHLAIDIFNALDQVVKIFDYDVSLRLGIHTGDVYSGFIENPTKFQLFGNSINIASRLESYSLRGTFTISKTTFDHLNHEDISERIIEVLGRPKKAILKGVGFIDCITCFPKQNKILIADDEHITLEIMEKVITLKYNTDCVQSDTISETFRLMRMNQYVVCVIDINFIDTCVFDTLKEFRNWENVYRSGRQKVFIITSDANNSVLELYSDMVDGFIDKMYIYDHSKYPTLC